MKVSEMLEEQLRVLCEIHSDLIKKLKEGKASTQDIENLKLVADLIEQKIDSTRKIKLGW